MTTNSRTSGEAPLDRVESHLLGLADETEYALYEAIWSLRGEYRDLSEAGLICSRQTGHAETHRGWAGRGLSTFTA